MTGVVERTERRDTRVPAPGVDAYYSLDSVERRAPVKNISPTGVYLYTPDRWPSGTTLLLTMKGRRHPQANLEPQVSIPARIVRHDDEGIGMEFVLENISTADWLSLFSKAITLNQENDPIRVFRIAKAFAFLRHVTPFADDEILNGIIQGMSFERTERAIDIVLKAEMLLAIQKGIPALDVPPTLIRQILEDGSRNQDEQMQRYWAGMLASTCLDSPESKARAAFVALLSGLTPIHIRILHAAGLRGIQAGWKPGSSLSKSFYCTMKEIKAITGSASSGEIEFALDYLDGLGLLEMTIKIPGNDRINLTPTLLGMTFYARCSGLANQLSKLEAPKVEA
jgi:hypothetical protein